MGLGRAGGEDDCGARAGSRPAAGCAGLPVSVEPAEPCCANDRLTEPKG